MSKNTTCIIVAPPSPDVVERIYAERDQRLRRRESAAMGRKPTSWNGSRSRAEKGRCRQGWGANESLTHTPFAGLAAKASQRRREAEAAEAEAKALAGFQAFAEALAARAEHLEALEIIAQEAGLSEMNIRELRHEARVRDIRRRSTMNKAALLLALARAIAGHRLSAIEELCR